MTKFLITVWPFFGHAFPNIAMAHALRQRGHEVAFYTGAKACSVVEGEGFRAFPFKRVDGEAAEQLLANGYYSPSFTKRARQQKAVYKSWLLDSLPGQIADLEEVIADWQPAVIVCDPTMWAPFLILHEKLNIPVAIYSWTVACMLGGPDAPPIGMGLPRARRWPSKLRTAAVGTLTYLATADIRRTVNAIRRQHGLPALTTTITDHAGKMPLYLVSSVPALDYNRHDLPPSVHYVGPCLWSNLRNGSSPAWIEQLSRAQPWVYITEGTLHNQQPLVLRAAAEGLADLPLQVVMTAGGHREPSQLGLEHLASNIRLERWVPDSEFIPRCAVLVTAGGASTILAALQAGVPMVVVPTEWDKPENAQRVVESGAGLRIEPSDCTAGNVRAAVERILSEPAFNQNAQRIAAEFRHYGGPGRAAELLEQLSDQPVRPTAGTAVT